MKVKYLKSSVTRSGEQVQIRDIEIGEEICVDFISMYDSGSKYFFKRDSTWFYRADIHRKEWSQLFEVRSVFADKFYLTAIGIIQ